MVNWIHVDKELPPKDRYILLYGKPENLKVQGNELVTFYNYNVYQASWDEIDEEFVLKGGSWLGPFISDFTHWAEEPTKPSS